MKTVAVGFHDAPEHADAEQRASVTLTFPIEFATDVQLLDGGRRAVVTLVNTASSAKARHIAKDMLEQALRVLNHQS